MSSALAFFPSGGDGTITAVGDVTSGAAFTGEQGTMQTFHGASNGVNCVLNWDDSTGVFGAPVNIAKFEAVSGGTTLVAGSPSTEIGNFLAIFASLGRASTQGVSGEQGTLICESTSSNVGLGALLLTGTNTGTAPVSGEGLFTHILFASGGPDLLSTPTYDSVFTTEDWSTGNQGWARVINVGKTGTGDIVPLLRLSGDDGTTFNQNNDSQLNFLVNSGSGEAFRVDAPSGGISFFGGSPALQQSMPSATAGVTYGAAERAMLQKAYDCPRAFNLGA